MSGPSSSGSIPDAPVNVRVIAADGTQFPIELAYCGVDDRGMALWESTTAVPVSLEQGFQLRADCLPARAAIRLRGM